VGGARVVRGKVDGSVAKNATTFDLAGVAAPDLGARFTVEDDARGYVVTNDIALRATPLTGITFRPPSTRGWKSGAKVTFSRRAIPSPQEVELRELEPHGGARTIRRRPSSPSAGRRWHRGGRPLRAAGRPGRRWSRW
jgi:hypothetical protein